MNIQENKRTTEQYTATYYNAPRPINIGDVFYMIKSAEVKVFKEACKVCEGKKELTINGVTFKCPKCDGRCKEFKKVNTDRKEAKG